MTGRNEAKPEPPKQSNRHRTWQRPTIQTTACHVQKTGRTPGQKQRAEFSETPLRVARFAMPPRTLVSLPRSGMRVRRPQPVPLSIILSCPNCATQKSITLHLRAADRTLHPLTLNESETSYLFPAKPSFSMSITYSSFLFGGCLKGCSERRNTSVMISLVAWNVVINDDDFPLFLDTLCKKQS